VLKFQVSPAAPCDGDHSEGENFGRRIQNSESRIQDSEEELRSQVPGGSIPEKIGQRSGR